jgi:NitT/TauT family transport system substrate-binding protein
MTKTPANGRPDVLRRSLLIGGAATLALPRQGRETVRIGVPTKTYFPTIISETAIRQKLFEKEGIKAELTIYRSGAEGFEAIAAGAADIIFNSTMSVAGGLTKGVKVRNVANGGLGYYGWYLVVKPDSPIKQVSDLAGKKVGITAAGSGSDILALWTQQNYKVSFTRVPVGGGGLVPNLLTGNIDATVIYSPLSFQLFLDKQARMLIDFGEAVPPHSTGSWIATDRIINERPQVLQKAINALYGGLAFLTADKNRATAIKLIAEIDEIPERVAAEELDKSIKKLSHDGEFRKEWVERALDMAKLIGMTNLAPVDETYVTKFKPVPTMA